MFETRLLLICIKKNYMSLQIRFKFHFFENEMILFVAVGKGKFQ